MRNIFLYSVKHHAGAAVLTGSVFALVTFFWVMTFGRGFIAHSDFLLVQSNAGNQDFYTSFKSSEYLGKVLGEAVSSERFIQASVDSGKMNEEILPPAEDKADRLKAWRDMVSVKQDASLGMISVEVQTANDRDAYKMLQAISDVLITRNTLFRGGDEKSVEVRLLSGPIVEKTPSMKQLLLLVGGAFLAGVTLALSRGMVKEAKCEREYQEFLMSAGPEKLTS